MKEMVAECCHWGKNMAC